MRIRWRLALPVVGLLLFAGVTYDSIRLNRALQRTNSHDFSWSFIQLHADPLNTDCGRREGCLVSLEAIWIEPGALTMLLELTAFPAFVAGVVVCYSLGRLGISEVSTFMISMPLLIVGWYYFVGWLIDRWRGRHRAVLLAPPAGST
jgi:hypothetical protein